jgi:hypothetical protein
MPDHLLVVGRFEPGHSPAVRRDREEFPGIVAFVPDLSAGGGDSRAGHALAPFGVEEAVRARARVVIEPNEPVATKVVHQVKPTLRFLELAAGRVEEPERVVHFEVERALRSTDDPEGLRLIGDPANLPGTIVDMKDTPAVGPGRLSRADLQLHEVG